MVFARRVLDSRPFVPARDENVFDRSRFIVGERGIPLPFEIRPSLPVALFAANAVIASRRVIQLIREEHALSGMLRDRNGNETVFVRNGFAPLHPRETLLLIFIRRRRPLRLVEIEVFIKFAVRRNKLRRIALIGRSAVRRGNADYDGSVVSLEAEPHIVVLTARIKSVVNVIHRVERITVGVKTDFRNVPALLLELFRSL